MSPSSLGAFISPVPQPNGSERLRGYAKGGHCRRGGEIQAAERAIDGGEAPLIKVNARRCPVNSVSELGPEPSGSPDAWPRSASRLSRCSPDRGSSPAVHGEPRKAEEGA